ncbi:MAG: response regulator transcription factor [Candidatus Marinimicrobia bacterium]|nr:response regulator transcription factor [Candidatus Neomarinimicrobiota bacterium]
MRKTLLVIDDDEKLLIRLKKYLERFDYTVHDQSNPLEGIEFLKTNRIDLIILDVMMPDIDGFEALRKIRKEHGEIPVIMLTARGEVTDRIVGLELGADDYLPKPFEPRELVARIQSILRRSMASPGKKAPDILIINDLKINFNSHKVSAGGEEIILTSLEFQLLKVFMENAGRVLDRNFLLDSLKGMDWETFDRSVDVLISRLRKHINDDPKNPRYIKTVWGTGYIFLKDGE